jgi:hypothetical protein
MKRCFLIQKLLLQCTVSHLKESLDAEMINKINGRVPLDADLEPD